MSGTLQLTLISGKLIHDTEVFGKMDPYCVLKLKSTSLKTKTHQDAGKFPSWQQVFNIRTDQVTDIIGLEVWDEDTVSKDDQIGVGFLSVGYLLQSLERKEEWFPLTYKDKKAGEILISHQFFPDSKPASQEIPYNPYPNPYIHPPFIQPGYVNVMPLQPPQYQPQGYPPVQPVDIIPQQLHPVKPPVQPPFEEFKEPIQINGLVYEHRIKLEGHENMNKLYFKTNIEQPLHHVEKIVVVGETKDQGHSNQIESSSWLEVVILDHKNEEQTGRITVFKNFGSKNYEKWTSVVDDEFFLKEIKKQGHQVGVFARSIGPGWICDIKECRIEIHTGPSQSAEIHQEYKKPLPKQKTYHFERKEKLHGRENMNELYIKTEILDKILEIEEIEIEGKTKDQGWSSVSDSTSWIEAVVVKENNHELVPRKTIYKNFKEQDYKHWKTTINDSSFLDALKHHGAQIAVYARSMYSGWICEVKEMEVKIKCLVE